jgi:Pyruvate/2-oxoacid:ferredoxin oxidoreductase delta subunit
MEDIYRQLQKHFDKAPVGYPATKSGVELRLLKHLFTEEEAKVALNLSVIPEPAEKIHKRFKKEEITISELEDHLEAMTSKGSIMGKPKSKKEPIKIYSRIPLAIGMFEFHVDRVTKELAKDFFDYEDEAFAKEFVSTKTKQMRTIPVNVKIDPEFHIGNYDNITEIIKSSIGPFAVSNCVCRQAKDKLDEPCKQTEVRETCLTIGNAAKYMMTTLGVGRELTMEETLKMITRAKKEGMVLQPENTQNPSFICMCCGCCCGILNGAKKFDKPVEFLHTNFYAEINAEQCEACEDCQNICQMEAIDRVNNHMEVNLDRCIGCGLCIPVCSNKAVSLLKKDKEFLPPKDSNDMYKKITFEKAGLLGTLKFVGKAALGQKV